MRQVLDFFFIELIFGGSITSLPISKLDSSVQCSWFLAKIYLAFCCFSLRMASWLPYEKLCQVFFLSSLRMVSSQALNRVVSIPAAFIISSSHTLTALGLIDLAPYLSCAM